MAHPPGRPLADVSLAREVYLELGRDWPSDGLGAIAVVAEQLPDPKELPEGTLVIVRPAPRRPGSFWARVWQGARFWRTKPTAHRAVRCTALLALGYRDVSVSPDPRTGEELAWGIAATSGRSS